MTLDVFKKIQSDFKKASVSMPNTEIKDQMNLSLERAKKDFL